MKKFFTLLALAFSMSAGAWAQTPFASDSWNGQTTFPGIKKLDNTNATKYVINAIAPICVQQENVEIESGNLSVTFQYKAGGSWGLDIVGVDLVKNDVVVKSDYHSGFTGTGTVATFTLSDVEAGTYTIRYWVPRKIQDGTADLTTTNNNSQGTITYKLNDVVQSQFTNTGWTINTTFRNLAEVAVPAELWKVMRTELLGTRSWAIRALSSNSEKYENNSGIHYYDHDVTLNAQDIYVYYRYSNGNHALAVKGTELLDANGKTVAVDFHANAQSGNDKNNCTFKLSAPATGNYTLRTIAEGSGGWDTHGNIYYYTQTEVDNKFASVKTALKNNVLGYPKATNANATAIINYDTENEYVQLCDHLNKVYGVTDINLPEDGKAYRIHAVHVNADGTLKNDYVIYSTSEGQITGSTSGSSEKYNIFIAKTVGDKIVLVNELGNYLNWFDSGNTTKSYSTKGAVDTYNATFNDLLFEHATRGSFSLTDLQLFGCFQISGHPKDNESVYQYFCYDDGNKHYFVSGNPGDKFYNDNGHHTFLFQLEEVENPNKVKLTNPKPEGTSSLDNKYVGTFSAPYNVQLPDGVVAYKASVEGSTVTFTEIGNVVPKNVGVLVYKESATEAVDVEAVPAISTTSVEGNAFAAMINGTINVGDYVLGNGSNGVGFYARQAATTAKNKAYIPASASSNLSAFRFDFEDTLTGIEAIESNTNATIFDLQGRRVQGAKSGLYIVNGKKVVR